MNASARQFLRLCAHWPQLGGDDELAEQRAHDWLTAMGRYAPDVQALATDTLIANWRGYPPSIGDWRVVAQSTALRLRPNPPALESGDAHPNPARLAALLAEATSHLTMARAADHALVKQAPRPRRGAIDPHHRMPSYDDLYPATPTQEETP